jgi:hypothetical protein
MTYGQVRHSLFPAIPGELLSDKGFPHRHHLRLSPGAGFATTAKRRWHGLRVWIAHADGKKRTTGPMVDRSMRPVRRITDALAAIRASVATRAAREPARVAS